MLKDTQESIIKHTSFVWGRTLGGWHPKMVEKQPFIMSLTEQTWLNNCFCYKVRKLSSALSYVGKNVWVALKALPSCHWSIYIVWHSLGIRRVGSGFQSSISKKILSGKSPQISTHTLSVKGLDCTANGSFRPQITTMSFTSGRNTQLPPSFLAS